MTHTSRLIVILGTALDPLADKITMLFIYSAFYLHNDIPSWLFMTIIGRDIALVSHTTVTIMGYQESRPGQIKSRPSHECFVGKLCCPGKRTKSEPRFETRDMICSGMISLNIKNFDFR